MSQPTLAQYIKNLNQERENKFKQNVQSLTPFVQTILNSKITQQQAQYEEALRQQKRQESLNDDLIKKENTHKLDLEYNPLHNNQKINYEVDKINTVEPVRNQHRLNYEVDKFKTLEPLDLQKHHHKANITNEVDNQNKSNHNKQNDLTKFKQYTEFLKNYNTLIDLTGKTKFINKKDPKQVYNTNDETGREFQKRQTEINDLRNKYPKETSQILLNEYLNGTNVQDVIKNYEILENHKPDEKKPKRGNALNIYNRNKMDYNNAKNKVNQFESVLNDFITHSNVTDNNNNSFPVKQIYNAMKQNNVNDFNSLNSLDQFYILSDFINDKNLKWENYE